MGPRGVDAAAERHAREVFPRRLASEKELALGQKHRKKRRVCNVSPDLGPASDSRSEVADPALAEPYAPEAPTLEEEANPEGRAPP
jgi:hypothetical protein